MAWLGFGRRQASGGYEPAPGAREYLAREMAWYDGQARRSMVWYRALSIAELLAAAGVTVLSSLGAWAWVVTAFGASAAVFIALRGLFKLPDSYVGYRAAAEAIRVQADLYTNSVSPYDGEDRDTLLILKLAEIHSAELQGWLALVRTQNH